MGENGRMRKLEMMKRRKKGSRFRNQNKFAVWISIWKACKLERELKADS